MGAWRAIEEVGLEVAGILGTSIGALVGAAIGSGVSTDDLEERARAVRNRDIARIQRRAIWVNGIRTASVLRGDVLMSYIEDVLPTHDWDELGMPVQVNAVELGRGETEWFGVGARTDVSIPEAVYASAALPVLYPPAKIGNGYYVDGGTGDALGLRRAKELGADWILGVDVGSGPEADASRVVEGGMVAIHQRVFSIQSGMARRAMVESWDAPPLLFIRPELDGYKTFDFEHVAYFVDEGYRATRAALESLRKGEDPGREVWAVPSGEEGVP